LTLARLKITYIIPSIRASLAANTNYVFNSYRLKFNEEVLTTIYQKFDLTPISSPYSSIYDIVLVGFIYNVPPSMNTIRVEAFTSYSEIELGNSTSTMPMIYLEGEYMTNYNQQPKTPYSLAPIERVPVPPVQKMVSLSSCTNPNGSMTPIDTSSYTINPSSSLSHYTYSSWSWSLHTYNFPMQPNVRYDIRVDFLENPANYYALVVGVSSQIFNGQEYGNIDAGVTWSAIAKIGATYSAAGQQNFVKGGGSSAVAHDGDIMGVSLCNQGNNYYAMQVYINNNNVGTAFNNIPNNVNYYFFWSITNTVIASYLVGKTG